MKYKTLTSNDLNTTPTMADSLSKMSPSELDKIKQQGSFAENFLNNNELNTFINWYKVTLYKDLSAVNGFTQEHDAKRVAIAHHIAGIEGFVEYLSKMVERKNRVVSIQSAPQN